MIREYLDVESPLMGFLNKAGQLITLSCLWFLGCVPLVTIGTSTTALYYAVIKSVRREQGSAVKEFWRSYKANLPRGIAATVAAALLAAVLLLNLRILINSGGSVVLRWAAALGLALTACVSIYICPVLSRFTMKTSSAWKLSFVMSLRFFHFTLAILAGAVIAGALQFYILPIPTLAVLPGICCYAATYPMEKALLAFMPPKEENDNAWYYED